MLAWLRTLLARRRLAAVEKPAHPVPDLAQSEHRIQCVGGVDDNADAGVEREQERRQHRDDRERHEEERDLADGRLAARILHDLAEPVHDDAPDLEGAQSDDGEKKEGDDTVCLHEVSFQAVFQAAAENLLLLLLAQLLRARRRQLSLEQEGEIEIVERFFELPQRD